MKKRENIRNSCAFFERDKNNIKRHSRRGFALMTVLMLASLLLVMLVGLLSMSSEEVERSRMSVEGERSRGLVEIALAEVKAKLMDGGEIPYRDGVARASMTACPGLLEVRRYDVLPNRGYQTGREAFTDPDSFFRKPFAREYERGGEGDWQPANPQWIALYSQKWYAPLCKYMTVENGGKKREENPGYNPERVFNINTVNNPFYPGRFYLGGGVGKRIGVKSTALGERYANEENEEEYRYRAGESSEGRPVYVQWMPLYEDVRYGALKPNKKRNLIVGRYAYWVDVENTKIHIDHVKREWEETALGRLTGRSDAEEGRKGGQHFRQWGEVERDTERVLAEKYIPRSYQLFKEEVSDTHGVTLYYRSNYGRVREEDRSKEFYEKRIFGWESEDIPPAIADSSVMDSRAFSALQLSVTDNWLEDMIEKPVQERNAREELGEIERESGQILTVYGWEEERDPLGRPKLDINEIIREGDSLFEQGLGLPLADHQGTPLQQFLARTEDPKYYFAYYPRAYPSMGRELSFVDGLRAFAGRGADADRYAKAMRDQQVVNLIEYGRDVSKPPYMDEDRGIMGAKSMPYVAEVALRACCGIWGLWAAYEPNDEGAGFIQLNESELNYRDDFVPEEEYYVNLAQRIYDRYIWKVDEYLEESGKRGIRINNGDDDDDDNEELRDFSDDDDDDDEPALLDQEIGPHGITFGDCLSNILVDVSLALVNPNPFASREAGDWELRLHYSWNDAVTVDTEDYMVNGLPWDKNWDKYGYERVEKASGEFYGAQGRKRTLTKMIYNQHFCPSLLPNGRGFVNEVGYFFGENEERNSQHTLYFRPVNQLNGGNIYLPGILIVGQSHERYDSPDGIGLIDTPHLLQPFRIHGWEILRRGENRPHHVVPWRHPGQMAPARDWWQMTVDIDGEKGPLLPPNTGVLSSTHAAQYGLDFTKNFSYPDFYSLEHFRNPPHQALRNVYDPALQIGERAVPFGLGSSKGLSAFSSETSAFKDWEIFGYGRRKNVAASWFSSQTIFEFKKFAESMKKGIPQSVTIQRKALDPDDDYYTMTIEAPDDPRHFYHIEEVKNLEQLEGLCYLKYSALAHLKALFEEAFDQNIPEEEKTVRAIHEKAISDLVRFILLQVKLRDEAQHHEKIAREGGRNQEATGRIGDDDFVDGMALVERLVCIDPVLGHRTGNPDLKIRRDGKTYRGHFYGVNGHPWRRYNYYFYHYDKDSNAPMSTVFEKRNARPEPDRCLTWYFRDPRRCDGGNQEAKDYPGGENYQGYQRRKVPLYSLTGSVLFDAILTQGKEVPDLRGERGWSEMTELEEDGVSVWPYGPGMIVSYGYESGARDEGLGMKNERIIYRKGSFLTHSPRGRLMTSIGEIGLCHSGFLQRTLDLDRPPIHSVPGVKRLGARQYGPPLNMLLDLVTPSNFRNEEGGYLKREQWVQGMYKKHTPENPRIGTWSINAQIAHDSYLAVREGAHGALTGGKENFLVDHLERITVHPALVPNAVENTKREIGVDPYLSPLVRFRRGWEHWLGVIMGDYSEYRNMGRGVWSKEKGTIGGGAAYTNAQGTKSFSWNPGVVQRGWGGVGFISFSGRGRREGSLLVLGKEVDVVHGGGKANGLGRHLSADGPILERTNGNSLRESGRAAYPVESGDRVSLYDVTRYGIFPLYHHISEVGYSGLGKVYTALNARSVTTPAQGGFWGEEELVDEVVGGDGILGGMSQAGFARNAPWVMGANQMSTSANVFTVHIVTQSLRDGGGLSRRSQAEAEVRKKSPIPNPQSPVTGLGYLDGEDEVLEEQWARVVVARIPYQDERGKVLTDKHGAPQYAYRILSKKVLQNPR